MLAQPDLQPVARLDFVGQGSDNPGWYLRHELAGQRRSERLDIELGADAFGAIEYAAEYLGCSPERIEFAGPVWPIPLDGLVPAEGALEFLPDPDSTEIDSGDWRDMSESFAGTDHDARQSARRAVTGVRLRTPAFGKVLNWSEFGMGIEIGRPLMVETRRLFKAQGKRSEIEIIGEVRWCRRVEGLLLANKKGPIYRAGITLMP